MSEQQKQIQMTGNVAMQANLCLHDDCMAKSRTEISELQPLNPEKGRFISELPIIRNMRNNRQNAPNPRGMGKRACSKIKTCPFTADPDLILLKQSRKDGSPDKRTAQWAIVNRLKNGESPGADDTAHGPPDFRRLWRCFPDSREVPGSPPGGECTAMAAVEGIRTFHPGMPYVIQGG